MVKNKILQKSTAASAGTEKKDTGPSKYVLFGLGYGPMRDATKYRTNKYEYTTNISNYLKTITSFEPEIAQFQNIVYNFNNNKKKFKINSILENTFKSLKILIGTPVFEITPNNLTINLFYYLAKKAYKNHILRVLLKTIKKQKKPNPKKQVFK